jgi:hypothetical protein
MLLAIYVRGIIDGPKRKCAFDRTDDADCDYKNGINLRFSENKQPWRLPTLIFQPFPISALPDRDIVKQVFDVISGA